LLPRAPFRQFFQSSQAWQFARCGFLLLNALSSFCVLLLPPMPQLRCTSRHMPFPPTDAELSPSLTEDRFFADHGYGRFCSPSPARGQVFDPQVVDLVPLLKSPPVSLPSPGHPFPSSAPAVISGAASPAPPTRVSFNWPCV